MAMTTLGPEENQKKEKPEVLLILTRIRAKAVNQEYAKVFYPGDQDQFAGSAKLQLLAMKAATRDLKHPVVRESKDKPDLTKMNATALDKYAAKISNGELDTTKIKSRPAKIKAIKAFDQEKK